MKLANQVVIVTGAGSIAAGWGIGKACSVTYARAGARVVAVDISESSAKETAAIIKSEGGQCLPLALDVSNPSAVAEMAVEVRRHWDTIDVLHHNVGIGRVGGATDISFEDWQHVQSVNVDSLFHLSREVLPEMRERRRGVILATSSVASLRYVGYPHLAYSVTKAATNHFIKMLALEHAGQGIRCNSIVAGLIDTPRIAQTVARQFSDDLETARAARSRQVPMQKMGSAWDVAHAALFLASDDAAYVTGTELVVDGGLTAKYA
ncbi:SDR family NAD(P)-dependent oxidoreductase [Noviherbaspirillum sp. CPCC 100848]|uniref:SDR family NAD(P)-dependent oxidoreductase n=1 Tax=Noviherbaspirillum album TaxID=3080276 RepID=A0ABU6JJ79_9BURK|nr:SDR family NAD(P)-dependent oxidoreductase [Noviherbaspirillum sp. CPCC 100848]MEC4723468.1 SDR family NAD(P)-dependent oxidoreductase [Noviherbaspirillum sp. CPCC 100848]